MTLSVYRLLGMIIIGIISLAMTSCGKDDEDRLYSYGGPNAVEIDSLGNPFSGKREMRKYLHDIYADSDLCEKYMSITSHGFSFHGPIIPWNTPPSVGKKSWRPATAMPSYSTPKRPLEGVRIGIDPGHIGGKWAAREQRENLIAGKYLVKEGMSTQIVATLLSRKLQQLGATTFIVRKGSNPVSRENPSAIARKLARLRNVPLSPAISKEADMFFVRRAELNARAKAFRKFNPDLTICLHFDAGSTNNPVDKLHLIVNGAYTANELADGELRQGLIAKVMGKVYQEETSIAAAVAKSMAEELKLPPLIYTESESVRGVNGNPYLWSRNLIANCLYPGPVIYTEPYAMNNPLTARRMVVGDYPGTKVFNGKRYRSIYRDYADSVAEGIRLYYLNNRPQPPLAPRE